ncbi:MAG: ATP-binding cassette domain-containing protein, partial [candidate division WOR-3 bacterium]
MSRVLLKGVTKTFRRGMVAVDGVDLEINDREFFVILGPSGCGKTTLLRIIAGLEDPDSGEIYIGERRVNDLEPKERDIAMV